MQAAISESVASQRLPAVRSLVSDQAFHLPLKLNRTTPELPLLFMPSFLIPSYAHVRTLEESTMHNEGAVRLRRVGVGQVRMVSSWVLLVVVLGGPFDATD